MRIPPLKASEQEPCDAISRQAALDIVEKEQFKGDALSEIEKLPSVNPQEPKTGYWIEEDMFDGDIAYRCSECNEVFCLIYGTPTDNLYNFCPNCGCKLSEIPTGSESEG